MLLLPCESLIIESRGSILLPFLEPVFLQIFMRTSINAQFKAPPPWLGVARLERRRLPSISCYISRRVVFVGSLISDASRLTRPSAHALHFQHSWRPLMFAYLFLARPKGTRSRHPSLTQGKPLVYHLRADRTPLRL